MYGAYLIISLLFVGLCFITYTNIQENHRRNIISSSARRIDRSLLAQQGAGSPNSIAVPQPDTESELKNVIMLLQSAMSFNFGKQGDTNIGQVPTPTGGAGGGGGGDIPNLPDLDLELPDGITNQVVIGSTTYYQLPPSPNYDIYTCPGRTYGLPEMLAVLNTVGKAYNRTYPDGKLYIGDINATGHKSHNWGVAVDIVTTDMDSMMDSASYNPERAKALARMFVATNKIKNIWFCDESVTEDALSFARQNNYSLENAYCIEGHYDHFHVDITTERGDWYTPGC